jgi:hypothetical protein
MFGSDKWIVQFDWSPAPDNYWLITIYYVPGGSSDWSSYSQVTLIGPSTECDPRGTYSTLSSQSSVGGAPLPTTIGEIVIS